MSDFDPRPIPQPSREPSHLPALTPTMSTAMGTPLPAAPWIEPTEEKGGFSFIGFLHALRRRWLLGVGLGALIASTVAALLWLLVPVKYEAFVQIRVRRNPEQILRDRNTRAQHPQDYEIEKQTQAALLKSPFVIQTALRQPSISQLRLVRDEPWFGQRDNPVAWLEKQLKVEFAQGSEFLLLKMRERYKDDLIRLLNAITDAYMREIVDAERIELSERLRKLKERQGVMYKEVMEQWKQIGELSKAYGSFESEGFRAQFQLSVQQLNALLTDKRLVDQEYNQAAEMLMLQQQLMVGAQTSQPPDFLLEDIMMQYPEYSGLKAQLLQYEQAMMLSGQQSRHAAASMQGPIATLKQRMEQFRYEHKQEAIQRWQMMNGNDMQSLQRDFELLQAKVALLKRRRDAIYKNYFELSQSLREIEGFSADMKVKQAALKADEEMMERIKSEIESLTLEMSSKPQIEVLQKAIIPDESNWTLKFLQIAAAWVLSLGGTLLGIALWDMQSQRVNNSDEVVEAGDLRVIGSLPLLNGRRAGGLLPLSDSTRRTIEVSLTRSIDSIRTALLFAKRQHPYEVVMVTSALGQEGKTTVASQLAVSFARSGRRTLLIDSDIRNPQLHVVLGMSLDKGLCDLLRSEVSLDDVVRPTPAEGLWFLGAGFRDINTDQYMASAVMGKLFRELRSRFDMIIVDTGPTLTSPDAMLIGQHVDAAVISVRRDVSRLPKVIEACERLRLVGIHIAGAVLNGAGADIRACEMALPEPSERRDPQLEKV